MARFVDGPLAPYRSGLASGFNDELAAVDITHLAETFREAGARGLILGWDDESKTGRPGFRNKDVASAVGEAPDVFVGFGAADPLKGAAALIQVHEAASMGLPGLSFHPAAQGISPGDRYAAPVWEAAASHALICLFHTGFTTLGAGTPGGSGIALGHGRPIHVDAIAAAYPEMVCVIAHAGRMWLAEAVTVAVHKSNVWLDLSRLDMTAAPDFLLQAIAGPLRDRCVTGSDYPFRPLGAWRSVWGDVGLPGDVKLAIEETNPMRLLARDH